MKSIRQKLNEDDNIQFVDFQIMYMYVYHEKQVEKV